MSELPQRTVRSAVAPLLGDARIAAPLTSQLLAGKVVTLLEVRGDWLHVRGPDAYEGWTHTGYTMPCAGDEAHWRISLGAHVRASTGVVRALPLGARAAPHEDVVQGTVIDHAARPTRFPLEATAIARSAETLYAGASYLWGGVTPWGCDCSGFVQRVFALHGLPLPRDAWQQALRGQSMPANASADHTPGDLLFFSDREDRRVTHVGIALDRHRMVHSALMRGGIAIEHLQADDVYVARLRHQCVAVQRVL
ncbi:MAG: C40 family peptidase [Gemmatimonadaceae bacterium]|nr:C40 family peptidase [Gemmatimonadaceae bacterium]